MVANNGDTEGLFHGAFMESGSPIPVGDITLGQPYYDALVSETGCSGAADTLQCLRQVPFDTLMNAVNQSPSISSYQVCLVFKIKLAYVEPISIASHSIWHGYLEPMVYS